MNEDRNKILKIVRGGKISSSFFFSFLVFSADWWERRGIRVRNKKTERKCMDIKSIMEEEGKEWLNETAERKWKEKSSQKT